tara:strand:- start:15 stop:512 length:498 start_codon:yes stop_codon:yes gene_type:complete
VKILRKKKDKVFVFENFLSTKQCRKYYNKIKDIGDPGFTLPFEDRTSEFIDNEKLVNKVKDLIYKELKIKLHLHYSQFQNWHIGTHSNLHKHDYAGGEMTKYNSLIYLNDDFDGGEFYTKGGIILKPKKGMLTLFNGSTVWHGLKKVKKKDRKTVILWWADEAYL